VNDASAQLPISGLASEEANFVYNVEVLGLPVKKAASMAGMPLGRLNAPHIIQAREITKRELRGALAITKEDVVFGMTDAIGRARLLAEPLTEIVGWEKVAKILGLAEPQKIDINISASLEVQQKQVKGMTDQELVQMLGAEGIIDAEFYDVGKA
jgi:hypothetical protein